ncbi:hypothetical protein DYB35_007657, partial [Aphanomyces astaci]
ACLTSLISVCIIAALTKVPWPKAEKKRETKHTPLLRKDLALAGMNQVAVWTQRPFNYFPRFTQEGLK